MDQISIFQLMYPTFKITKPIRLIELFAGVGSQAMALRDIGANFVTWKISEWEVNANASYKAIHCDEDKTDYSEEYSDDELVDILFNMGISGDGKNPLTKEQIGSHQDKTNWLRQTYNNIKATHNLVNICAMRGGDLDVTDTDHFTYIMTYSFP